MEAWRAFAASLLPDGADARRRIVGRILLELLLIVTGYLLGGRVGIGSILSCVLTGPCMQFINRAMKFDLVGVRHESLPETGKRLLSVLKKDRNGT